MQQCVNYNTHPRLTMLWIPITVDDCEEIESSTVSKNTELMTLLQVFSARLRLAAKLFEEEDELLVDSVELKGRL